MSRAALIVALVLAASCGKKSEEPEPSPTVTEGTGTGAPPASAIAQSAAQEATALFKSLCSTCHGESGKGDGPGAVSLDPKPRNYTDKTWQASVTDEQIAKTIVLGGAAVGKSPLMPPNPQLRDKPLVVSELVRIIRGFAK
jgi:cytochrome c553